MLQMYGKYVSLAMLRSFGIIDLIYNDIDDNDFILVYQVTTGYFQRVDV